MQFFRARRVERRHVFALPDGFDLEWVSAYDGTGALLQGVLCAAFANSRDPGIGLNRDEHIALVEKRAEVGRFPNADARDFSFREGRMSNFRECETCCGHGGERLQK